MKYFATRSFSWCAPAAAVINGALLLVLCSIYNSAQAEGGSLLINGISFHKTDPEEGGEFNEKNWGLGYQYDFPPYQRRWAPYFTLSALKDSHKRNSFYVGGGLMRHYSLTSLYSGLRFDAGLVGFMMVRKDHHNRKPFIGALPAFSLGTDKIAINASYIPKVEPKLSPLWFFQLKLSFSLLESK